jgi:hypothetical protein
MHASSLQILDTVDSRNTMRPNEYKQIVSMAATALDLTASIQETSAQQLRYGAELLRQAIDGDQTALKHIEETLKTIGKRQAILKEAKIEVEQTCKLQPDRLRRTLAENPVSYLRGPYILAVDDNQFDPRVTVVTDAGRNKVDIVLIEDRQFFFELAEAMDSNTCLTYQSVYAIFQKASNPGANGMPIHAEKQIVERAHESVSRLRARLKALGLDPKNLFRHVRNGGYRLICIVRKRGRHYGPNSIEHE